MYNIHVPISVYITLITLSSSENSSFEFNPLVFDLHGLGV